MKPGRYFGINSNRKSEIVQTGRGWECCRRSGQSSASTAGDARCQYSQRPRKRVWQCRESLGVGSEVPQTTFRRWQTPCWPGERQPDRHCPVRWPAPVPAWRRFAMGVSDTPRQGVEGSTVLYDRRRGRPGDSAVCRPVKWLANKPGYRRVRQVQGLKLPVMEEGGDRQIHPPSIIIRWIMDSDIPMILIHWPTLEHPAIEEPVYPLTIPVCHDRERIIWLPQIVDIVCPTDSPWSLYLSQPSGPDLLLGLVPEHPRSQYRPAHFRQRVLHQVLVVMLKMAESCFVCVPMPRGHLNRDSPYGFVW